ncbi:MAG: two-component system response regulator [Bacteroidota bacterium]|jgi:CheY-like chemotaxis protein|nr:two-component system response regulator [Bacteroidota bacterium]
MADSNLLIFLADDDEDDRLIFSEALSEIDPSIKLVEAADGLKLLNLLSAAEKLPDVIFLDLNMPLKNGKDTLRFIRSDNRFKTIPVVLYSTSSNPADIEESFNAGGSLYLEKPYSMCGMVNNLKDILFCDWSVRAKEMNRKNFFISSKESSSVHSR